MARDDLHAAVPAAASVSGSGALPRSDDPLVAAWLEGTASLADIAPRRDDPQARRARRADHLALMARADAARLIAILRTYVRATVPMTRALERTGWAVTGPSAHAHRTGSYARLAAVVVGPEETLVLGESRLGEGEPEQGGFLLVDQQALESQVGPVGELQREFGGSVARTWVPGADERGIVSLGFYDLASFHALMAAPRVVTAARVLNMRLLHEGPVADPQGHVLDLADHLVAIMPGDPPPSTPAAATAPAAP